jgi:hypothetical protein
VSALVNAILPPLVFGGLPLLSLGMVIYQLRNGVAFSRRGKVRRDANPVGFGVLIAWNILWCVVLFAVAGVVLYTAIQRH